MNKRIQIKGKYSFTTYLQGMFLNEEITVNGENLITLLGESFFMNRWINDNFNPIKYILLGKGSNLPRRDDSKLGYETVRKTCNGSVNIKDKELWLTCTFTVSEFKNVTEIGVSNGDILISHDVFDAVDLSLLVSDVHLNYIFSMHTGNIRTGWKQSTEDSNIYYIYEPNKVTGVREDYTDSGYVQRYDFEDLKTNKGSYYYDNEIKQLYIRRTRDNININDDKIIVQT